MTNLNNLLENACRNNDLLGVKQAVVLGADLLADYTPYVSIASENDNLEMVKYLVNKGVCVADSDSQPLRYAKRNMNPEMVKFLVKHGAGDMSHNPNDYEEQFYAEEY